MSWFFPTTRLCRACTQNDLATVKLLADASNINTKGFLGWAPLHNAASAGNADVVEFLLSESLKAEVDLRDLENHTPLMLAAGAATGETDDRVRCVKLLLTHKADPNAIDEGKYSPLQLAVLNNNKRVAELLLEAGAKINHQNLDRFTALHAAAGSGNADLVQLLVARGAEVNMKDGRGKTPDDHAKEAGFDFATLCSASSKAAASSPTPSAPAPAATTAAAPAPAVTAQQKTDALKSEIEKELADMENGTAKQ